MQLCDGKRMTGKNKNNFRGIFAKRDTLQDTIQVVTYVAKRYSHFNLAMNGKAYR